MIPLLDLEFQFLIGRLGAWPGEFGPEQARALFSEACKIPAGGLIVDVGPLTGKSTVLLAAAAHRNGNGQVLAVMQYQQAIHQMWFGRAITLFNAKNVQPISAAENMESLNADFICCRNNAARAYFERHLKRGGVLFGLNIQKLDSLKPEQTGPLWSMWRKPDKPELHVVAGRPMPPRPVDNAELKVDETASIG